LRGHADRPPGHALTLYLRSRGLQTLVLVALGSAAAMVLPIAELRATPSPAGATVALAVLLALALPIAFGWSMMRGDSIAERTSPRSMWIADLSVVLALGVITIVFALALRIAGVAPAAGIAARALATFLGVMLIAYPITGWRTASLAPVVLFLVVVIAGRGTDIDHPAPWAWIAAPEADGASAVTSGLILALGTGLALARGGRTPIGDEP
jgi:hypothetical protein